MLKCGTQFSAEDKDRPADFLKFTQATDLNIVLVSPKRKEIIVHPLTNRLVHSIYIKHPLYFSFFLIWVILDLGTCSYLCMAKKVGMASITGDETYSSPQLELVITSIVWIAISAAYRVGKFFAVARFSLNSRNSAATQLNNCNKKCQNALLKQDHSEFVEFQKQLKCSMTSRVWIEAFWTAVGTLARVSLIIISVVDGAEPKVKNYTLFIATVIIFLENSFHDANDIFCIPNSVLISLLSMKEALGSFVTLLPGIFMLALPYFLITLKFAFKEKHYFTNIERYERPEGGEAKGSEAVRWSMCYLYKVMLTDDYQVDYFNDNHPEFFAVFHVMIVFLLSLVVMNLIIAQTSQTYEEFIENSKAEILRHRIFTITLFGLYRRAENKLKAAEDDPSSENV